MDSVLNNLPAFWNGFATTLYLAVFSGLIALVLGTFLATMRVSPLPTLRALGTGYVELMRNTPLTLVFVFVVFVLPTMNLILPLGRTPAIIALSAYTSAFVCEAVRSGINSVGIGQAEAARAIGLTGGQTLSLIVLPQAIRTVIPPIINVLIALAKNTSIAAGFTVVELTATTRRIALANPGDAMMLFAGAALFYLIITVPMGQVANYIERKVAFSR